MATTEKRWQDTIKHSPVTVDPGGLTARQREILDFIGLHLASHGRVPTVREIGVQFDIRSPNGVIYTLRSLERKGYIRRSPNISRGIELVSRDGRCPCCLQAIPADSGKDN